MTPPFVRLGAASRLYSTVERIQGFFNYDDAQHFSLLLEVQRAIGIGGDLLEIGTWKGRSAAFLSFFLSAGERLWLCDVFSAPAIDTYPEYPSAESVRRAIVALNPVVGSQLQFVEGKSDTVVLPVGTRLRFAHIDGGHSLQECYADLARVGPMMIPGGVVAVDDYDHPDWPEVRPAADRWLSENPEYHVVGDLNRTVAKGRKLYAMRRLTKTNADNVGPV